MTVFKSAYENYTGKREDSGILKKLENRFRGYRKIKLNLLDFINHNRLDMILNNDLINEGGFELYNYDKQLESEIENMKSYLQTDLNRYYKEGYIDYDLEGALNYYDYEKGDILKLDLSIEDFEEYIEERAFDSMYEWDIYQYFIIPDNQAKLWETYTNYPIYYNEDLDLFLVGITHYGMSWKYFSTTYTVREYLY